MIKVRLQCSPRGTYAGPWDCLKRTVQSEGPRALYKGPSVPSNESTSRQGEENQRKGADPPPLRRGHRRDASSFWLDLVGFSLDGGLSVIISVEQLKALPLPMTNPPRCSSLLSLFFLLPQGSLHQVCHFPSSLPHNLASIDKRSVSSAPTQPSQYRIAIARMESGWPSGWRDDGSGKDKAGEANLVKLSLPGHFVRLPLHILFNWITTRAIPFFSHCRGFH